MNDQMITNNQTIPNPIYENGTQGTLTHLDPLSKGTCSTGLETGCKPVLLFLVQIKKIILLTRHAERLFSWGFKRGPILFFFKINFLRIFFSLYSYYVFSNREKVWFPNT